MFPRLPRREFLSGMVALTAVTATSRLMSAEQRRFSLPRFCH